MKDKSPTIILFFYRFMEFRLFFQNGLLKLLEKKIKLIVVVPEESVVGVKKIVGKNVIVEGSNLGKLTVLDELKDKGINALISRILSLVYGIKKGKTENITPKIHFESIIKLAKKKSFISRIVVNFIILFAKLASKSYLMRKLLQRLYAFTSKDKNINLYFTKYNPNLVVVGSCGLSADGWVMLEAKKKKISTLVVLQTWDRTSSKGYPTVQPDYMLTWSQITAIEANIFLDIPKKNIFIGGAPIWDDFFLKKPPFSRKKFCNITKLDFKKKIIVFAMNSLCYHESNMEVMAFLGSLIQKKKFLKSSQLFLRLHPSYFSAKKEKYEMDRIVSVLSKIPGIVINTPETDKDQSGLLFTKLDQDIQISSFYHCDLTISCLSTYMIESSIFNKPAINLMYGRWKTNLYDLDVSKVKVHHIQRIYNYKAIYQVRKLEDLLPTINKILKNPNEKTGERKNLVNSEISKNQGRARTYFCKKLIQLAKFHHNKN